MSFSTPGSQTVPVPGNVTQETNNTPGGLVRPVVYNKSHSGGRAYLIISGASTTSQAAERLCVITITGGTMGAITVYDNASAASGTIVYANPSPTQSLVVDMHSFPLTNGLTVVAAAATNFLVSYE